MENDDEIIGVRHDKKITGLDSNNESMGVKSESEIMGATEKVDEMARIEEAIAEAERDIAEGTELLAGTETETEDTWYENVMHPDLQVPTVEHTYNFRRISNPRPDYTNRYGFQATIIHCALTQLSMKRRLKKFVSSETGKAVLYVRLQKALYGCIISALLFYDKLVGDLEGYGFRINPYDPCVANKMVGRKQLTV